jgi:hypothetical protein
VAIETNYAVALVDARIARLFAAIVMLAGCGGADDMLRAGPDGLVGAPPAQTVAPPVALKPGTVEELNKFSRPSDYISHRMPPSDGGGAQVKKASQLRDITDAEFADMVRSPLIRKSPELVKILVAARGDTSGRALVEVARSLPIK